MLCLDLAIAWLNKNSNKYNNNKMMKICGYFMKCKEIWKCLFMASRTVGVSKEKYGTSRRDFYAY